MDTAVGDKKIARLTNPGPDDQLMEILKGSDFEDYKSPLFIAWQINSACNLGCLHCCEESGHSMPDELSKEQSLDFCRQKSSDCSLLSSSGILCPDSSQQCRQPRLQAELICQAIKSGDL